MGLYQKTQSKEIVYKKDDLASITMESLNIMSSIVGSSLGPGGRVTLLERDGMAPIMTKDGYTIARALGVDDARQNTIIEACKEICLKTVKDAGDGSTTSIILANALVQFGLEFMASRPKYNAAKVTRELEELYNNVVVPFLKEYAIKADSEDKLRQVATISANGDTKIAEIVVEAIMSAGDDGVVLINEAQGNQLKVDTINGYVVTSGLKQLGSVGLSFINDKANQRVKMDQGIVFCYNGTLNDLKVPSIVQTAIEGSSLFGKPLIFFAHGFSDLVVDKFIKTCKGGYTVVPVVTPMSGVPNSQSMFLDDMAAYTSGKVYDPTNIESIIELQDKSEAFGEFDNANINVYECFVAGTPEPHVIDERVTQLKALIEIAPNEFDKMHLRAALNKLTCGVSTIMVGGSSDIEIREKIARVEDAVEAVRSAVSEGVVPGGCGVQLVLADMINSHPDRKESWQIMSQALLAPFKVLLENCGEDVEDIWPAVIPHVIGNKGLPKKIFDAAEHKIVDPFEAGIIEPAKVLRVALSNALSVSSLLIGLGGIVCVARDKMLENQLELSKEAFKGMMSAGEGM